MREPVFNETVQLGIVVRDLEATVRRYEDDYGIGPWEFARIDLGEANDYREHGEPAERSNRIAMATVGRWTYEVFAGSWGTGSWGANQGENPISVALNTRPKYVASTTLTDPKWT